MLRLFTKRAHLSPYPFIRKPLEPRRFLMATGNFYNLSKVEQIQEAVSEAKPKGPIPGDDRLANRIGMAPAGDHLIHPETDFKTMESNIIKAIRELSSRTDTNIANTRRELVSQMAKVHRELNSEVAQHHREIDSKVARTQRELDSKIAQHHRKLESEMASNHRELKSEMASNHRGLKYEVDKLDTIDWIVYLTFILSLCTIFGVGALVRAH